jgi:hypothetical protein
LWTVGLFFPVLVFCTKKNLATLRATNTWNNRKKAETNDEKAADGLSRQRN